VSAITILVSFLLSVVDSIGFVTIANASVVLALCPLCAETIDGNVLVTLSCYDLISRTKRGQMMKQTRAVPSAKFLLSVSLVATLALFVSWICSAPAQAKTQVASSEQHYADGVTVRKNADGTVETFDSGSAAESIAQQPDQIVRRPMVSHAYSKVIGGVHVRRNSDGTVETYEPMSRPVPLYPSSALSRSAKHRHNNR
jgi:hypothetical protein